MDVAFITFELGRYIHRLFIGGYEDEKIKAREMKQCRF